MNTLKRIDQISKLRVWTIERAASVAEQDSAAVAIGRILMRDPELVVSQHKSAETPKLNKPSSGVVVLDDVFISADTPKAILCDIPGHGEIWIPRSQLRKANEVQEYGDFGRLVITTWLAKQKGLVA